MAKVGYLSSQLPIPGASWVPFSDGHGPPLEVKDYLRDQNERWARAYVRLQKGTGYVPGTEVCDTEIYILSGHGVFILGPTITGYCSCLTFKIPGGTVFGFAEVKETTVFLKKWSW